MIRITATKTLTVSLVLLAGCASPDVTLSTGVESPCGTVKDLIAEYPEGFPSYRGKANNSRMVTTFRATEQLIEGHCEIWQWGAGDTAYICTAEAPSHENAIERYDNTNNFLQQCLGPDWSRAEMARNRDGEPDGQLTRFTSDQHPGLSISAHLISGKRGPQQSETNYFYLGAASQEPGTAD